MHTLSNWLRHRAKEHSSSIACTFLDDEGEETIQLTYADLDRQARVIGSHLSERLRPGDRALMLYPPGPEFVAAFLGCLYAGVIPVPAYPPKRNQKLNRLLSIATDAVVSAALTTAAIEDRLNKQVADLPPQFRIQIIA